MAKASQADFHRAWNEEHDQAFIMITVNVDQVFGTRAHFRMVTHQWLPNSESTLLAKYASDSTDSSEEAMRAVLERLLDADYNRRILEAALAQKRP